MYYVYILKQISKEHYYIGYTSNLNIRLKQHNSGLTKSTNGREWIIHCCFTFTKREIAEKFELYLKSHSGRSFAKRHFDMKGA